MRLAKVRSEGSVGASQKRRPRHREGEEARKLLRMVSQAQLVIPALELLFHVPNGGKRSKLEAMLMKGEGVKRGVPDYLLPLRRRTRTRSNVPTVERAGLFLELKAEGGSLRPEQREWLMRLAREGYAVAVAFSADEAFRVVCDYALEELLVDESGVWDETAHRVIKPTPKRETSKKKGGANVR